MKTYTIREVGQLTGFSSSTLRYYEEEGILKNVQRTENQQRIYTDEHLGLLGALKCLKGTGMSIQQLRLFFLYEEDEQEHIDEILELLTSQRKKVMNNMEQLQRDLDKVERKIHYYHDMKEAHESGNPLPSWSDYSE